jgi:hypothetical protein
MASKLVWDSHQSLTQLARHNRVELIWLPGHEGISGNLTADLLGRTGSEHSEHPFTGPEQSVASQSELPRERSETGRTEITHTMGIHNWTQTGKGTYIRALCQKNKGSVEIKQRPTQMDSRTIHRTLSSKGTSFQTGIYGRSHL